MNGHLRLPGLTAYPFDQASDVTTRLHAAQEGVDASAHDVEGGRVGSDGSLGVWEHVFAIGESGSPYGRFRRALERRQSTAALSAAAELQHLALTDALELLLLLRDRDPTRYTRAVLRWHGRFCREVPGITPSEAGAVLSLLAALEDDSTAGHAARALAELLDGRELDQPARVLVRWADDRTRGLEGNQHRRRIEP